MSGPRNSSATVAVDIDAEFISQSNLWAKNSADTRAQWVLETLTLFEYIILGIYPNTNREHFFVKYFLRVLGLIRKTLGIQVQKLFSASLVKSR